MRSSLVNVVWFSEKRRNLLLLLSEGKRDIEQIKRSLNVTTRSIMPQIKTLRYEHLIIQEGDYFSLTSVGEIIVKNMLPFMENSRIVEENRDFWASRNIDAIPPHLFSNIRELGHYFLIEPDMNHLFELPREFIENIPKSKHITTFVSYIHPAFPSLYSKVSLSGVGITLFLTAETLEKLEQENEEDFRKMIEKGNTDIFLYEGNPRLPMVTVTDWFSYICLFNNEGRYDHRDVISFDESALNWCQDLFDHYRQNSRKVYSGKFAKPRLSVSEMS
ncbi:helix-turn-helix transcriptional regulator [Methanolobus halotolerans]|uniref:Transcriptional regulator n=1 Tax=Methanolobus halotolerans TaxID=2052935 RepID=A0A4E0QRE4_9EURY|nr:winged helix-turn-helix domain-containing protein [Methanolobus halotolerans]TGC08996.1 transcriptional regulator [Methanolobus halotolerans]